MIVSSLIISSFAHLLLHTQIEPFISSQAEELQVEEILEELPPISDHSFVDAFENVYFNGIDEVIEELKDLTVEETTIEETTEYIPNETGTEEEIYVIGNRWGIYPSDDEIYLLAAITWLEARGESSDGQCAVIEVVFNRVLHGGFYNSIYGVLSEPYQFVTWGDVYSVSPTSKEYESVRRVVDGETWFTTMNTVYFGTRPYNDRVSCVIGNHYFCEG